MSEKADKESQYSLAPPSSSKAGVGGVTSHPTSYGKFVLDKYIKEKNTLERYLSISMDIFTKKIGKMNII